MKADLLGTARQHAARPRAPAHQRLRHRQGIGVSGGDNLKFPAGQMPEWRLKICSIFCESAERAITMSHPASCACIFNSPCMCER